MKNFSVLRKKKAFVNLNFNNEEAWIKTQKLQEHIEVYGGDLYLFLNPKYFIRKPRITKELVKGHFHHYGGCKHYLAVKIYLEEIQVIKKKSKKLN